MGNIHCSFKLNIKTLARGGNGSRKVLHRSQMRFPKTTETNERIDCSQTINLFQHNASKHQQTNRNLRVTILFNNVLFAIFQDNNRVILYFASYS